jgi:pyridoxal phosphate enzyme (YggS family)
VELDKDHLTVNKYKKARAKRIMFENIAENYHVIVENIAEAAAKYRSKTDDIRFMAVTKTVPAEFVNKAIDLGIKLIGENRVQEYLSKKDEYKHTEVHFIGSLQSNKVRKIIDTVSMIHSVDGKALADEINRQANSAGIGMDVLIELNIGNEDTKSGVTADSFYELAAYIRDLDALRLRGLMVIPPPGNSDLYFGKTEEFFHRYKDDNPSDTFDTISMGMSSDYTDAIKYGSNIVRIGSALFGARVYK